MARAERSHVRKRRRGCLGGCLTRILLLLGLAALLFVAACVMGFVKNDPVTGAPSLTLEGVSGLPQMDALDLGALTDSLGEISLPDAGALSGGLMSKWAYGVKPTGLTVKTLRAGDGEAVLVCADGYTMLVGGGSGMGVGLCAQLLMSGVHHLNAVVATSADQQQIGGLPLMLRLMPPDYLLYQDSQVKGTAYNRLIETAEKSGKTQLISPERGLTFSLGRATVTVIGPVRTAHTDQRDDGLSLRVDYGNTSVLIMGTITAAGERELISSGVRLDADVLICAQGGSDAATCQQFAAAVSPEAALLTGKDAANSVRVHLQRAGAKVYAMDESGVMTVYSDGYTVTMQQ